jgi:tetratricopeptide (TPR) repeat protein
MPKKVEMNRMIKQVPLLLLALLLALTAVACRPSKAEQLNKEGNDAFTAQAFQDALAAYQTAQIEEPELAEPYYNAANALYRQGAYEAALEQLQIALSFADQDALAQAGYYNLGNSSYNAQDLESAIASYKQALLLNPDDQDAKYNLELALQQQEQQQQNEQQQEQEQEQEDQQDQEQSDQGEQQDEQQSQDGEGEQEQQEQQQGDQPSEEQQSDQGEQQDEGQNQDGEGQQEQQDGQPGEGKPQEAQPDPQQEGRLNDLPQPGQRMTEEQARQLLAAIARDGETLQERLGQIFSAPWRPPVQDW